MRALRALAEARGRTWLAALDPRAKLVWLAAISTLSVLVDSLPALAALAALAALPLAGLRMRPSGWMATLALLALAVWGTVLSQAIFYPGESSAIWLRPLPWVPLYREGARYGLLQSLRVVAGMCAGLAVSLGTSPERLLGGLSRLGVPSAIGFMCVTALRFLPDLMLELATVRAARRLRGHRFAWWRPAALAAELSVLAPLVAAALRRAQLLAVSVVGRGFDPGRPRTDYPPLALGGGEWALMAACGGAVFAASVIKGLSWLAAAGLAPALAEGPLAAWARWL